MKENRRIESDLPVGLERFAFLDSQRKAFQAEALEAIQSAFPEYTIEFTGHDFIANI